MLTGLQFVVMALVADQRRQASTKEVDAFSTPTIVHFCAVLLISAIVTAPWPSLAQAATALAVCGGAGVVYAFIVLRRARRQSGYAPVAEDWIWHVALPLVGYAALLAAALATPRHAAAGLFGVAAAALVLLFVGIHNAWDTAIFIALAQVDDGEGAD